MNPSGKRFLIAFSFASEKREFVAKVAAILAARFTEEAILYDKYHEAEFSRARLGRYLPKLYHDETGLVVVVISKDYSQKEWTGLEWDAILDLLKKRKEDEVMLCRFGHSTVEGLFSDAGFVELDNKTAHGVATLILQRLALNEGQERDYYALEACESEIDVKEQIALPITTGLCFGRQNIIDRLHMAWNSSGIHICTIVAAGGVGKTSIVKEWLKTADRENNRPKIVRRFKS
jgi:TIR domain